MERGGTEPKGTERNNTQQKRTRDQLFRTGKCFMKYDMKEHEICADIKELGGTEHG